MMSVYIGASIVFLIISCLGIHFKNFIGLLMLLMGCFGFVLFTFWMIHHADDNTQFIEVQQIDSGKYIQCIESLQYLVSQIRGGNSTTGNSTTVMLNASGKPIPCIERIYTSDQKDLPENKNKMFIEK